MKLLVINGPNIQLLGRRDPGIYGSMTLPQLELKLQETARELGVECEYFQSNHEGAICDRIAEAAEDGTDGIVINPAAYTHTSIALLEAVKSVSIPTVEVHISKVEEREDFRQVSYIRAACVKTITGHGTSGYLEAIDHLMKREN